jgi:transcriptional regulator with XRE-family HTH domain
LTPREFGAHLRAARLLLGESQSQTAGALGVTRQWLTRVEAGTGNPSLRQVFALCDHLGVDLAVIDRTVDRSVVGSRRADREADDTGARNAAVDLDVLLAGFTTPAVAPPTPAGSGGEPNRRTSRSPGCSSPAGSGPSGEGR